MERMKLPPQNLIEWYTGFTIFNELNFMNELLGLRVTVDQMDFSVQYQLSLLDA